MGIDHAETRKVINYGLVKNLESLVQMTGRAGRDGQPAECVLFYSSKDYGMVQFWAQQQKTRDESTAAHGGGAVMDPAARSKAIRAMFDVVKKYVTSAECRRVSILTYFGEDWHSTAALPGQGIKGVPDRKGFCGHCDNCLRVAQHQAVAAAASAPSTAAAAPGALHRPV